MKFNFRFGIRFVIDHCIGCDAESRFDLLNRRLFGVLSSDQRMTIGVQFRTERFVSEFLVYNPVGVNWFNVFAFCSGVLLQNLNLFGNELGGRRRRSSNSSVPSVMLELSRHKSFEK